MLMNHIVVAMDDCERAAGGRANAVHECRREELSRVAISRGEEDPYPVRPTTLTNGPSNGLSKGLSNGPASDSPSCLAAMPIAEMSLGSDVSSTHPTPAI